MIIIRAHSTPKNRVLAQKSSSWRGLPEKGGPTIISSRYESALWMNSYWKWSGMLSLLFCYLFSIQYLLFVCYLFLDPPGGYVITKKLLRTLHGDNRRETEFWYPIFFVFPAEPSQPLEPDSGPDRPTC